MSTGEQRLWSVTSLIKLGLGTSDALVNWAVRTTAEYAVDKHDAWATLATEDRDAAVKVLCDARWQTSKKAAARGTDLHTAAEQLALGQTPQVDEPLLPYVEQYRRFLEDHQPAFVMSEAPVYAPTYSYAGTCDGIIDLHGRRVVFDIKTTDKTPDAPSRPPYPEIALQLVAYSRAELVGLLSERREVNYRRYYIYDPANQHEPMPRVDGAVAIVVSPVDYRVVPIRVDDEVWRAWGHVREAARWQVDISRRVIGPDITAPAREVAV